MGYETLVSLCGIWKLGNSYQQSSIRQHIKIDGYLEGRFKMNTNILRWNEFIQKYGPMQTLFFSSVKVGVNWKRKSYL
jgi:hypothetical protein